MTFVIVLRSFFLQNLLVKREKMDTNTVEHEAFVRKIEKNHVIVDVLAKSACMSCQLKGVCSVSDIEEKEVKVPVDNPQDYEVGNKVIVYMSQNQALNAVWMAYVVPLLLVLTILIVLTSLKVEEGIAALLALAILPLYYLIMFLLRKKIAKKFDFKIKEKIF